MTQFEWAVEITLEYLDEHGFPDSHPVPELKPCRSEAEATARYKAAADTIKGYGRGRRHPKYQRLSAVRILRRPVGEWEEVPA